MIIIAIAGASGSGKTIVAHELSKFYGEEQCTVISADNYYNELTHLTPKEKDDINFDHPSAIDFLLFSEHLAALKKGDSVSIPIYDFKTHSRKNKTIEVHPKKIIIIEGILALHSEALAPYLDIKIFVKADLDLCLMRRMNRDVHERGRTMANVLAQYAATVRPMYVEFVAPSQKSANLIVKNNSSDYGIDVQPIQTFINYFMDASKSKAVMNRHALFSVAQDVNFKEDQFVSPKSFGHATRAWR